MTSREEAASVMQRARDFVHTLYETAVPLSDAFLEDRPDDPWTPVLRALLAEARSISLTEWATALHHDYWAFVEVIENHAATGTLTWRHIKVHGLAAETALASASEFLTRDETDGGSPPVVPARQHRRTVTQRLPDTLHRES